MCSQRRWVRSTGNPGIPEYPRKERLENATVSRGTMQNELMRYLFSLVREDVISPCVSPDRWDHGYCHTVPACACAVLCWLWRGEFWAHPSVVTYSWFHCYSANGLHTAILLRIRPMCSPVYLQGHWEFCRNYWNVFSLSLWIKTERHCLLDILIILFNL